MILIGDKLAEVQEARRLAQDQPDVFTEFSYQDSLTGRQQEPPPSYTSLSPGPALTGYQDLPPAAKPTPTVYQPQAPARPVRNEHQNRGLGKPTPSEHQNRGLGSTMKSSNYVSVFKVHNSVKETVLLDPGLHIPPHLLPELRPLERAYDRSNLRLESTHGQVYADVAIVPGASGPARLWLKSTHGSVTAKIHTTSDAHLRPTPFHLHAQSTYGDVRIHLPRTFHGPLKLSVLHGSVKFSDALSRQLTTFGEMDGTRRCFVGDFSGWREGGWQGDEVVVDAKHGSVKVMFEDDGRSGFFNKVFGF